MPIAWGCPRLAWTDVIDNWVRRQLQAGSGAVGCFLGLGSPSVGEMLSHLGFDWLLIETEHNAVGVAETQQMLMAMNGSPTVPLVRVASAHALPIQRVLDLGAAGVVVPLVRTADEARAVVAATRYPPAGTRTYGPLRATRYTIDKTTYFAHANENILVVLIVETTEAMENLDEIAQVPGVDVLYLGPSDLSLSMGLNPTDPPDEAMRPMIQRLLEVADRSGVSAGIGASSPQELKDRLAQGFRFVGYASDYALLSSAARAGLAAVNREPSIHPDSGHTSVDASG